VQTPTGSTTEPTTEPTSNVPANPTATSVSGPTTGPIGDGNASVITVIVTGGPHAGTHERRSSDATCSYGLIGADAWGNQYSDADITQGLSSLQLIVPSGTEAANGTSNFNATFTFGELFGDSSTNYTFEGREGSEKEGDGTVTISGTPDRATIKIEGEPAGGVTIDATIECNDVFRVSGGFPTETPENGRVAAAGIDVTLDGGLRTGEFSAVGGVGTCAFGPENTSILVEGLEEGQRSNAWTVEYYNEERTDEFFQFELLVPDGRDASDGTGTFYLNVNDQDYYIYTVDGQTDSGTGTVTVKDNGDSAIITVDAKTGNGGTVKGTVTCHQVTR
jgi:hypothetical protein